MIFSFLKEDNLAEKYSASKEYTETLTQPFPEFERIARNRPHLNKDPRYPNTTDGTTASVIRKLGKRVVQQLPTGAIETDDDDAWLPIVAGFIYTNKILPYANLEYDLIQKCWQVIERGATFGATGTYSPFINHDGYFCPDLTLPYWGDIFFQPGKKSGYDCDYVFLRSWWQPENIESLIEEEKKRKAEAKANGEKYESTWDLEALEKAKEMTTVKDEKAKTPHEQDRSTRTDAVEVITGFQKGVGATFFTFIDGKGDNTDSDVFIIRRKENKDPRGKYPIDWFYYDTDGSNPMGRGIVELIGGLQNLIDSDMQMYQYNRALMLAPPLITHGNIQSKKLTIAPNAILKAGNDPAAKIEALNIDTSAVVNYPSLYGLQKSQLLNLVSSPDTSISAEVGNPGFGKTPTAINAQQATMSVDDNFVRKMFEAWWENWSETNINLYFAERSGVEELQLDDETAQQLRKLIEEGKLDPSFVSDDDKIMINYDTATPILKFRVDASTSKMKEDATQGDILSNLLGSLDSSQVLAQIVPPEKIIATWNRIITNSGVEDPEDLQVDVAEFQQKQQQAQALAKQQAQTQAMQAQTQSQQAQQPAIQQTQAPQGIPMSDQETPMEQTQEQPGETPDSMHPDAQQVMQQLSSLGLPDSILQEAQQALLMGEDPNDVIDAIMQLVNGDTANVAA